MTHINAYYQEVAEAEKKVVQAQGELEAAKDRLAAKQVEIGEEVEPSSVDVVPKEEVKVTPAKATSAPTAAKKNPPLAV